MKRTSIIFLQAVIALIGVLAIFALIRFPMLEGRAVNLNLWEIYSDPFILYAYVASIAFFVALYKAIKLLGYISSDKLFSVDAVKTLRTIRYCAIITGVLIVLAGIYIMIFHHEDDDPAGFMGMCILTTFISVAVATAVAVLEKILQRAVDMKSENDLTI
ncbi:DUF2975 domain-containing protein [Aegicerativicinus sediminis]|uniref:DUF2975 domain-containing protein n=1 Tax=Aegicerativicinus sediminis TaxID=2893202 RepID=UPI001E4CEAD2|nr:DUF2975 domain-containing protein [Aegicerativicinus sediminis]